MDDISVKKKDIEKKLNQEQMILSFLKESLAKSDQITGNMLDILSSFESRIHKLEETIVPVHKETVDLQRRQANIDKSLSDLDHIISYHHVYANTEHVIREAPTGHLDVYIKNLERVLDAIEFFTQNNPNCLEMTHLCSLRDFGRDSLEKEFRTLLNRHSKPVPSNVILDSIGEGDDGQVNEDIKIEHLSDKVIEDLSTISHWLVGPGKSDTSDFMSVYAQIRSTALLRSMQGLKDAMAQGAAGSGGTKFKAGTGVSTPTRKGTAKKKELRRVPSKPHEYSRRTTALSLQTMALDTKDSKEEEDDIHANAYIMSCKALLKLMASETELMKPIIPDDHQHAIFDKLIQAALEAFMTEGEVIVNMVRRFTNKHIYVATMQVFPILKQFRQIQPDFDDVLQNTTVKTRKQFPNLINVLELTASRALDEFADGIRHGPEKHASNMPRDGTVHELTRNTLLFMEQLLPYVETVGNLLATQQESHNGGMIFRDEGQLTRITAEYVQRVLGSLGLNLQLKTKVYESVTLTVLFLLNNYHYILKALQRSGLLELLHNGEIDNVENEYQVLVEDQKKMYEKCWSKVLHFLLEMEKPGAAGKAADATVKLKDKHRQMIKDKFKGFNTEFEELYQIQKTYAIPDVQLREEIRQKNIDLIVPLYRSFRDKYEGVPFTKNPEKYVKYSADEIENLMNKFFDVSA